MATLVLDTGAPMGIERRSNRVRSIVEGAEARRIGSVIPTVVVAQAVRGGPRLETSWPAGRLLGECGAGDVVDAAVVVCTREYGRCPVVTSDLGDIRKLDAELAIIQV